MKSSVKKLVLAASFLVISLTLAMTVTYAWFTLSTSPEINGMTVMIGGNQTIQIAPDALDADGETHIPGTFAKTMNISEQDSYEYLKKVNGLLPVSTADGIHWYIPTVEADKEAWNCSLEDGYKLDEDLAYANKSADENGRYIYLDFWVKSPLEDCTLRLSTVKSEADGTGSYLIGLPKVVEDGSGGFQLSKESSVAAACARVGFLVNNNETGEAENFIIYEPNGDLHPAEGVSFVQTADGAQMVECTDGTYTVTSPIGCDEEKKAVLTDVSRKLVVQEKNTWKTDAGNSKNRLENLFETFVSEWMGDKTASALETAFYEKYQSQLANYLTPGLFYQDASALYPKDAAAEDSEESTVAAAAEDSEESTDAAASGDQPKATATAGQVIVTLRKDVPQRIRMFIWLEGQDVDCVREAAMERFALGLEFAGSTENEEKK